MPTWRWSAGARRLRIFFSRQPAHHAGSDPWAARRPEYEIRAELVGKVADVCAELDLRHGNKPGTPERALMIRCVKGGEAVTSKTPFTEPIGKLDTAERGSA